MVVASGAKVALRIGPSLPALNSGLRISQLEEEWLKNPPGPAVDVVDELPCNLMIGLVELPNPFEIAVIAKHSLPNRQTVRKQYHESDVIVVRKGRSPKRF